MQGPPSPFPAMAAALALMAALSCVGQDGERGAKPPVAGPMAVEPSLVSLLPGMTAKFTARHPAAGTLTWSVQPAGGGTVDGQGLFTATGPPGTYIVWGNLSTPAGSFAGSAQVLITRPPVEGVVNPQAVLASGQDQHDPQHRFNNDPQVGQALPSRVSGQTAGGIVVRHGFVPPVQDPADGRKK